MTARGWTVEWRALILYIRSIMHLLSHFRGFGGMGVREGWWHWIFNTCATGIFYDED